MSDAASFPKLRTDITLSPFSSSSRDDTFLLTLSNGRSLQVSAKLVDLMNRLDGEHSIDEIARDLSIAWQTPVRTEDVQALLDRHLVRHDLLLRDPSSECGSDSSPRKSPSTKGILLVPARCLLPATLHLRRLFHPALVIPLLGASAFCHYDFYTTLFSQAPTGLAPLTPETVLAGYLALFGSVLFHELGHLSASRYFHCPHGEIRFGLYLIFPVFYANVTPSWRLERKARLVVDLGGVYFQLILLLPCFFLLLATQNPLWTILILQLDGMICFALNPFLRFDGYWVCSDLLGVPNLRSRSFGLLKDMAYRLFRRQGTPLSPFLEIRRLEKVGLMLYAGGSLIFFLSIFLVLLRVLPSRISNVPSLVQKVFTNIQRGGFQHHTLDLFTLLFQLLFLIVLVLAVNRMLTMILKALFGFLKKGRRSS